MARYRIVNKLFYEKLSPCRRIVTACIHNFRGGTYFVCADSLRLLFIFILCFAVGCLGRRNLWGFFALSAFGGVAYRVLDLKAWVVIGASLVLILLGILLKCHQPNNIACSLRRKGLRGTGKIDLWYWEDLHWRWWTHSTAGLSGNIAC